MNNSALIVFSAISIVLCLLPVRMQWRARNTGTLLNILWNLIGNLIWFLNAVIWWNRFDDRAPVFCDFSVKLQTAIAPGLTAASLCINRRLASIAMSRAISGNASKRRLDLAIDLSLGIGLPVILMALSYIVQMHRYDIFEGFGCELPVYVSIPAIFVIYVTPIVLGVISAMFGVIAVWFFLSRRLQFNSLLKSSQSGLDTNQYVRLVSLASLDLFISLPLNIFFLVQAVPIAVARPWPGFTDVHYNWHRVDLFDAATFQAPEGLVARMLSRWICPTLAIIFFIFFGVSRDAVTEYTTYIGWIAKKLRIKKQEDKHQSIFVPKLGSAVAEPVGAQWNMVRRDGDMPADGLSSPGYMRRPHPSGMSVVVKVEKEVV